MSRLQSVFGFGLLFAAMTVAGVSDAAPKKPKKPTTTEPKAADEFDKNAAITALAAVDLGKCKSTNAPRGEGHLSVNFQPGGAASDALVDKGPMAGTPVAKCIAKEFNKTKIPAFKSDAPVHVGKIFRFE